MKHCVGICTLLALTFLPISGSAAEDSIPEYHYEVERYGEKWMKGDKNADGTTDYVVYFNEDGLKAREAVDYNKDGLMDDFYYYENEVLVREEVDTNYDQAIDLWVYLHRGVYIERYERDTDYDGKPDVVKNFRDKDGKQSGEETGPDARTGEAPAE
jgi:hypothetical protein